MAWLDIFKRKTKKFECFACTGEYLREDCVEIAYRYGSGKGTIGKAYLCKHCEKKYGVKDEDEDYVESI
jgi:O-acetyl-ADP-ribose deacetylase (regulator of RNase III)